MVRNLSAKEVHLNRFVIGSVHVLEALFFLSITCYLPMVPAAASFDGVSVNYPQYEVDALMTYGRGVNYTKNTIDSALTSIGTSTKVILTLRPGTWIIDDNLDMSSYPNIHLNVPHGAVIQLGSGKKLILPAGHPSPAPEWFGAKGDGTEAAKYIQDAVNSVTTSGGVVYFSPSGRYLVSSSITVSSLHPVSLVSNMSGAVYEPAHRPPGIIVGKSMPSVIKYTAPDPGKRALSGGGSIKGINFYDATGSGEMQGRYVVTSILELNDFNFSSVEDCTFHWINGSAIQTEGFVMSSIRGVIIRYSGATKKPAINLKSSRLPYAAQSFVIADTRMEVNYGDTYISIKANSSDGKIYACGFEAETEIAGSNHPFITNNGDRISIFGNHFNRNTGTLLSLGSGSKASVFGNTFGGNAYATTTVMVAGHDNTIHGNYFAGSRTSLDVDISGGSNALTGNTFYYSGGVRVTGPNNTITGNSFRALTMNDATIGYWLSSSGDYNVISANSFSNQGGTVFMMGALKVAGIFPVITGNSFRNIIGRTAIRNESGSAVIVGNSEGGSGASWSMSSYGGEFVGNYFYTSGSPLTGLKTYDPPLLTAGASVQTTVTVTGAVEGDYALAAFSPWSDGGVTLSVGAVAIDTVYVTFTNVTDHVIDLKAGTLKAKVIKR